MLRRNPALRFAIAAFLTLASSACSKDEEPSPALGTTPPPAAAPLPQASPPSTGANTPESVAELASGEPIGVFEGTLPCADCPGIRTILTLYLEPDRYVLQETRLGGGEGAREVRTEGRWSMLQGVADAPDATVIRIDPGKPEGVKSFLEIGGSAIELLDQEGHRMDTDPKPTLQRRADAAS